MASEMALLFAEMGILRTAVLDSGFEVKWLVIESRTVFCSAFCRVFWWSRFSCLRKMSFNSSEGGFSFWGKEHVGNMK